MPCALQVSLYTSMFLHRPGTLPRHVLLRANKIFLGKEKRSAVLVDAGADNGELYVAVLMFFLTVVFEGTVRKCAFLRWYEKFGPDDAATGCRIVRPEKVDMIVGNARSRRTVISQLHLATQQLVA